MFNTWYEEQAKAKMASNDGFEDYQTHEGHKLYAICKVNGRIPEGEPLCKRNPDKLQKYKGQGYCIYYRNEGSYHCDHRFPPKEKDD